VAVTVNGDSELPDLTGAEVYVEVGQPPVAGGRWYVILSPAGEHGQDRVVYQRPTGEFVPNPVVPAHQLRDSSTWRPLDPDTADGS
jgi:phage repressor protein C with HTH and peptisase S24 domain